jgi:neutral trehalase
MTVVVDFDGTILPYVFPDVTEPYPEAVKTLRLLKDAGWHITIHTCRTANYWRMIGDKKIPRQEKAIKTITDYMEKYDIPFDSIWLADKPLADLYIDDRGVEASGGDWSKVLEKIGVEEIEST